MPCLKFHIIEILALIRWCFVSITITILKRGRIQGSEIFTSAPGAGVDDTTGFLSLWFFVDQLEVSQDFEQLRNLGWMADVPTFETQRSDRQRLLRWRDSISGLRTISFHKVSDDT